MRSWRLVVLAVAVLLACPVSQAPGQSGSRPGAPAGPVLRLGALLPLSGPGAWFGAEIKQGLELAVAELDPAPERAPTPAGGGTAESPAAPAGASKSVPESAPPARPRTGESGKPEATKAKSRPPAEPIEPPDRPRTLTLVVQALDVQPLDLRATADETSQLLGTGVTAIVTASPTPALTAYPLAAARDVLVLHAGLATDRFPATSRTLLHLRPSAAARADVLGAHAWARGLRRVAVAVGGDDFGRALRAAFAARWRQQGGQLTREESVSLDAADLRARLRRLARTAPEAVVLGFQGAALGEVARTLREAGYAGLVLGADDDRAALLAGGRALDGALILSDAFVPLPGSRGARFARSYEARHGEAPSRFAATAYETATLLAEAAQRALRGGRGLTGSRLRDALVSEGPFPSLYAGELVVREDGTVARPLALFRVDGDRLAFETYVGVDGRALGGTRESTP
jgi:ABC-type branched-subunit amino acid transport system substrate-binding protein